jgi:hypothetical protein
MRLGPGRGRCGSKLAARRISQLAGGLRRVLPGKPVVAGKRLVPNGAEDGAPHAPVFGRVVRVAELRAEFGIGVVELCAPVGVKRHVGTIGALSNRLRLAAASGLIALIGVGCTPSSTSQVSGSPSGALGPTGRLAAADLTHGHWEVLPPAPVRVRTEASEVWTGKDLLVWGGLVYGGPSEIYGDGAGYDPATRRWRQLPASPLAPRFGATGVWTGSEFVIWGGVGKLQNALADGAAYDPVSNAWRRISSAPISGRTRAFGTWTGSRILVWGGQPAITTPSESGYIDGALYDPKTDSWQPIGSPSLPPNHPQVLSIAVWTGRLLYVWKTWERWDPTTSSGFAIYDGTDGAVYDSALGSWNPVVPTGMQPLLGGYGVWTGSRILVREAAFHGPMRAVHFHAYDPAMNSWTDVPAGALDMSGDLVLTWVGNGLVVENAGTGLTGPAAEAMGPGDAGEYFPGQDRWIKLPSAPQGGPGGAPGFWTGHVILYWGAKYPAGQSGMLFGP